MVLLLTIDKLKYGNRFYPWLAAVRAYLEAEGLWDVVDIGFKDTKDSIQKELRAKYIILCLVDVAIIQGVHFSWSSKKLWDFVTDVGPSLQNDDANKRLPRFEEKAVKKSENEWFNIIPIAFMIFLPFIFALISFADVLFKPRCE